MKTMHKIQNGFSLVSAIFLLVIIAGLGLFAVTVATTQHQTSALDVAGARAFQAARAGVEWGVFALLRTPAGVFNTACTAGSTSQAIALSAPTLAGFTVNVQCTAVSNNEGDRTIATGNPVWVYTITSTAQQGTPATPDYVERQMTVTIWRQ